MTVFDKIKLFPVWVFLKVLTCIENVSKVVKKSIRLSFWVLLLVFIAGSLLGGIYVDSIKTTLYRASPVFSVLSGPPKKLPYEVGHIPFPEISAQSVVVADAVNNVILVNNNGDERLAPASTTKLMTALVSLDLYSLDEYLFVPNFCATVEGTKIGLFEGEKVKVKDLMFALLVGSANDAACVFANAKVSGLEFIKLMNAKAETFGLSNTHFTNAVGLDGANGSHYSSAYDLYSLARIATQKEIIKEAVRTKEYEMLSGKVPRKAYTTNYLLWAIPESVGVKTGKTEAAGEVLIYEYKDDEKDLIIVVMGSQDRFFDTRVILDWVLENYRWQS